MTAASHEQGSGLMRRVALWPLLLIVGMQAAVSLVTLHNSAFQDEGLYLYAGYRIVHHWMGGPAPLDHYAFYFSGYPDVYPLIGGALDMVGGLALARAFSLLCMLGVTAVVYSITRRLFGRPAAIFASATYAFAGVVLFVGRLAVFDALCLFLIAVAAQFAVRGGMTRSPWRAISLGPILVLAIGAKYAAILFVVPVIALLACVGVAFVGWRTALHHVARAVAAFAASLGVAYLIIDKAALHAIVGSTTNRAVGIKAQRFELFTHVLRMGALVWVFALLGAALMSRWRGKRMLAAVLFGSSWLAPVYHIYSHEPISLDKHIAYGLFFAVPLAGYALAWLSGYMRRPLPPVHHGYWFVGGVVVVAMLALGLRQSHTLYRDWGSSAGLSYALHTQLRSGTGRIMAEDIEVARFDAKDVTAEWQWSSFYYPAYETAEGQTLFGDPALADAVDHRYFDFVELSFNYFPDKAYHLAQQMADSRNYDLVAAMPFQNSYGRGHYFLWRSALEAGQGDFTTVAQVQTKAWFACTLRVCQGSG
jgi:4-amino-4-deoxy-L-arabinose transferase-like glycosyltransferase